MSVLVIQFPARKRLGSPGAAASDVATGADAVGSIPTDWFWATTANGTSVEQQGTGPVSAMPQTEAAVGVLSELDVSWHAITLPRAPAGKLRAALVGVLEEHLLTEPESVHVAVAPAAEAGERAWVAIVDRVWLTDCLAAFERQGLIIDRVVPQLWPGDGSHGHFFDAAPAGGSPEPAIAMADVNGIACLPIAGTLARALLPASAAQAMRWTAPPSVAAAAERWLGAQVSLESAGERLLRASRSTWNLRQFDLVARRRGTLAVRDAVRRFMRPAWRPLRLGLICAAVVQVLALNLWAWSHRQVLADKQEAQSALLTDTHPQVRVVRNPPLQMERETEVLRAAAGRPGPGDFETLLAAASAAWPEQQGPMQNLRFQPGQLSLAASGWSAEDTRRFSERLKPAGLTVTAQNGRVTVARGNAP
jgi:general secretion pathway protein L